MHRVVQAVLFYIPSKIKPFVTDGLICPPVLTDVGEDLDLALY